MSPNLQGILPALVSPMLSPGEVDVPGLQRLVEHANGSGASGVLVAGPTGEGQLLPPESRVTLVRAAVEVGGQVVACASGATLADVQADVARLSRTGVSAVLALAPAVLPLQPSELVTAYQTLADRTDSPMLVYHVPQLTGSYLTAEAAMELTRHHAIVGLKDSSPDPELRAQLIAAVGDQASLLTGHTPTLLRALQDGASGAILASANLRLRQAVSLLDAVTTGDSAIAGRLQEALTACESGLRAAGPSIPAAIKAALQLDGMIDERWCMPPLGTVPPGRLDLIRTCMMN